MELSEDDRSGDGETTEGDGLFRSYDPEIPAQVISVFLYIASHDDVSKVQIQTRNGVKHA